MKFREHNPRDLVSRLFILEALRTFSGEEVGKESTNMVTCYEDINIKGETVKVVTEVNWEYCLFEAPEFELNRVISTLDKSRVKASTIEGAVDTIVKTQSQILKEQAQEAATKAVETNTDIAKEEGFEQADSQIAQATEGMQSKVIDCTGGIPDLDFGGKKQGLILPTGFKK